jgi:hypothetical protein
MLQVSGALDYTTWEENSPSYDNCMIREIDAGELRSIRP